MNKAIKYFLTGIACFLFVMAFAQEENSNRIFVKNKVIDNREGILVKWLLHDIYTTEGVNVYRKEVGDSAWIKINENLIKKGDYILTREDYGSNEMLEDMVEIVNTTPKGQLNGMALLGVLINAIQSNPFARFMGLNYFDTDIEKGKNYQYKVTRMIKGIEKQILVSENITAGDSTFIDPPQNIKYVTGNKSVAISWKPEEERYFAVNVYRKIQGREEFEKMNTYPVMVTGGEHENGETGYPDAFYIDEGLQNEKTYTYYIKAIDFFGDEGASSVHEKVVPEDLTPPNSPKKLKALAKRYIITLTWDFTVKDKITGFNIYRSTSDKIYSRINDNILPVETREYVDNIDTPGGYYYYVTSINEKGVEGKSQKSFAEVKDITPPVKPLGLELLSDTGKFILSWQGNPDHDLIGYQVFRRVSDAKYPDFSLITPDIIKETFYIEKVPENVSNLYEYKIAALDSSLNRSEFSDVSVSRLPDVTPPAMPHIKSVIGVEDGIIIEWYQNFETDMAGYDIFRKITTDTIGQPVKINKSSVSLSPQLYKDKSADRLLEYNYYLVAYDEKGNRSEFSPAVKYSPIIIEKKCAYEEVETELNEKNRNVMINWKVECSDEYKGAIIYRKSEDMWKGVPITGLLKEYSFKDKLPEDNMAYYYSIRVYYKTGEIYKSNEYKIEAINTEN